MLIDQETFALVENFLTENGVLQDFEAKNGKILGRMMITEGAVTEELGMALPPEAHVFLCTYDFYDYVLGLAFNPKTKESYGRAWAIPQTENSEAPFPTQDWIDFFVKTLMKYIGADGSYGVPMYTFLNNRCEFTIVPTDEREGGR